jgi:oligopeptide/dipeptide ABC transporter ATP-binding protein
MPAKLLEINDLTVKFLSSEGEVTAVNHLNLSLDQGESLGIVGESGCGKSVSVLSILGLIPNPPGRITGGEIFYSGRDLLKLPEAEMRKIRGNEIAMVFQEPMTSLNPILTCGFQIAESLIKHKKYSKKDALQEALELLKRVEVPSPQQRLREYPHQLSGGLKQRVVIAMALACQPKILIADEPTTALDVTIQAQILELMKNLRSEINAGVMMITHDLGIVSETCERVIVMYTGHVVEEAPVTEIFNNPYHPYTVGLLKSIPRITSQKQRLNAIKGTVPNPTAMPSGCTFSPRCDLVKEICHRKEPQLCKISEKHFVRCWHYADQVAVGGGPDA